MRASLHLSQKNSAENHQARSLAHTNLSLSDPCGAPWNSPCSICNVPPGSGQTMMFPCAHICRPDIYLGATDARHKKKNIMI
ncbi:hypothetical protein CEXT_703941 [Caerostris extrusa]|uniref:Uncharacterized protein n=1 Tax=Caerostris extrusa TaxID=172846 RepID=A0AAV4NRU2_CAEEX|nr:hypothetical protein CEXT_703941 [Caerostris extrusa]